MSMLISPSFLFSNVCVCVLLLCIFAYFLLYSSDVYAYKPILKILFRECNIWLSYKRNMNNVNGKKTTNKLSKLPSKRNFFGMDFFVLISLFEYYVHFVCTFSWNILFHSIQILIITLTATIRYTLTLAHSMKKA